ncbi:hypothetical protein ABZU78_29925, partial [Rhodococcus erythropolis]|uniref:hypothetical protein n=1 Tax=Rhodococcus erythropolis TaxID=1833 RepID=UPI0033ADF4AF
GISRRDDSYTGAVLRQVQRHRGAFGFDAVVAGLNVKGQNGGTETPLNIATCTNTDDQEWEIIHPSKD